MKTTTLGLYKPTIVTELTADFKAVLTEFLEYFEAYPEINQAEKGISFYFAYDMGGTAFTEFYSKGFRHSVNWKEFELSLIIKEKVGALEMFKAFCRKLASESGFNLTFRTDDQAAFKNSDYFFTIGINKAELIIQGRCPEILQKWDGINLNSVTI